MLNLNPDKRATAQEMLSHEWLDGVIVEGEIAVHLANEAREEEALRIEQGTATANEMGMSVSQGVVNASIVDPLLVHALRPVDGASLGVADVPPPPPPSSATLSHHP